jgi:uncharacterized protein (DUF885 family)
MALGLAVAMLTPLGGFATTSGNEMDRKLDAFFRNHLEEHFRRQPMEATLLGEHRFDHLLESLSRSERDSWVALARQTLAALPQQVDFKLLSRDSQIDYEILQQDLTRSIWLAENTHPFEEDPRAYSPYISDCVYLLLTQSTQPKETNIANCIARIALIPRVVAAAKENLRNPPRAHLETAIRQNQGAIGFYEQDLFECAGSTPQLATLKSAARQVAACLKDYQK